MNSLPQYRKQIVASLCGAVITILVATSAFGGDDNALAQMDDWFAELADPGNQSWERPLADIEREWSRSGSPALDLLLMRGRQAMEEGDLDGAIGHLTTLTDQAPDFAEGWNARATAFYMAGRLGQSMADIRRVLILEPRHFGALSGLGLILNDTGDKQRALAAFRQSLAINPHQDGIAKAAEQLEQELSGQEL